MIEIREGGLDDSQVIALLDHHAAMNEKVTPAGSCHYFCASRLKEADVSFYSAWEGAALLGVGAWKRIDDRHGEVKSMHTSEAARRRGVGAAILEVIIERARAEGVRRLSLETGSMDYFAPARALYAANGFAECAPFGDYGPDPNSIFMTRGL